MPNSRFKTSLLDPGQFTLTFELVPGRGSRSIQHTKAIGLAQDLSRDGRICAVSVTDNAGGHAMLAPGVMGQEMLATGLDVISHFSCKDKNRNKMESLLFGWDRVGLRNLLVISGDYPQQGYCGHPKPVFDLDSVQAVDMIRRLNSGEKNLPTNFFIGVAVSPFKLREAEQYLQYRKLERKQEAGAHYVITQLGFDARKYHEALLYINQRQLQLPLLGNVFIPTMAVAHLMRQGKIPGCILPESLWRQMEKEARRSDGGKQARLERGGQLLAILRGMGYNGAHLGGPGLNMADIDTILNQAEKQHHNWQELLHSLNHWPPSGFYFFKGQKDAPLNQQQEQPRQDTFPPSIHHWLSARLHDMVFSSQGPFFPLARRLCRLLEDNWWHGPFSQLEHVSKFILFGCRNCGDCTLSHFAYLCPQSGCAKYLLNGPCGGSQDGWCEVYPGKKRCHYVKAYERVAGALDKAGLCAEFIAPRDWSLNNTSSWMNYFAGRDHSTRKC